MRAISTVPLGDLEEGELVAARVGRYGPYLQVGDTDRRASIPDDLALDELSVNERFDSWKKLPWLTVKWVFIKELARLFSQVRTIWPLYSIGRTRTRRQRKYQKRHEAEDGELVARWVPKDLTLEQRNSFFPILVLGVHPETKEEITVQDGRLVLTSPYPKMKRVS